MTYSIFEAGSGWVGLVATDSGVFCSVLPRSDRNRVVEELEEALCECPDPVIPDSYIEELLVAFFAGSGVDLNGVALNMERIPPFHRRVYEAARTIPRGAVMSYGEVARLAGNPRAARAVGAAMAKNPFAPFVPCHRVVGSDGALVGFGGRGGLDFKRSLLNAEGVKCRNNRVVR
ncbi:MAG: MGMT family protein [Deltaproteobacteria bacterium]|nr:MGMT family protein [Candidatus Zymogenaceae bacterium]